MGETLGASDHGAQKGHEGVRRGNGVWGAQSACHGLLICQPDAIVVRDDLQFWVDREWSYIGAPWTQKIIFKPNFHNKPHLSGAEFHLEVGNGGPSLRRIEHTLSLLSRYQLIISEFSSPFEDAMFALLGVIDSDFKIAPFWEAVRFSMEINGGRVMKRG